MIIRSINLRGIALVVCDGHLIPVGGDWQTLDQLTREMVSLHYSFIVRRLLGAAGQADQHADER